MSKIESKNPDPEAEAALSQLLHDFKNQLGGLKLYAAFLRKSLAENSLDVNEGIEVCDKMIHQLNLMSERARRSARLPKST